MLLQIKALALSRDGAEERCTRLWDGNALIHQELSVLRDTNELLQKRSLLRHRTLLGKVSTV